MPSHAAKVVVIDGGYDSYETERSLLAPLGVELLVAPCEGDPRRVVEVAAEADALLVRETVLSGRTLARLARLRAIVRYGVGTDNIDLAFTERHGIAVANVPDYGVEEVSEHALALLLALKRRLFQRDAAVRQGGWGEVRRTPIHRTRGGTLGLIGAGRIGTAFLEKARPLGFAKVLVHSRDSAPAGTTAAGIERICRQADVVSLHLPLTRETRNLIDADRLALMKPTAILINTARGGLVDEAALAHALRAGRLAGAGLDVFAEEPLPADSPLRDAPNCVLSDHAAWYSEAAVRDLQRKAAEEVRRALLGEPLANPVRAAG